MTVEARDVAIVGLGAQGDGIAETPDGPLFVPFALPGETGRVVATRGQHARLVEVVSRSAARVAPTCRHFRACGGCVAQHMAPPLYAAWKQDIVVRAFAHRGLTPVIGEMVGVPPRTRRRAVMAALQAGTAGDTGTLVLGFHAGGSSEVVAITQCHVVVPAIEAALAALRALAAVVLSARETAQLTVTATPGGLDVVLDGAERAAGPAARAALGRIAAANGILRLTWNSDLIVQSATPRLAFGNAEVGLPVGAFIQATAEAEHAIGAIIATAVGKARRVADLFAGVGTFSLPLARRARVLAIDADRAAIAALEEAARHGRGLKPIETRVRDLLAEPLSRKELGGFDAVVFDPPRAGARAQAEMLAKSAVRLVVAVSCNPATLARDARILVDGGLTLGEVIPIDQFVWSPHIEAVAVFRRG